MVTMRKPVGASDPPNPVAPIKTSSFHVQDAHSQLLPSASDSETPNSAWATEEEARDEFRAPPSQEPISSNHTGLRPEPADSSLPLSLQAGAGRTSHRSSLERPRSNEHIPESLRPGPASQTPRSSQEGERPALKPTNPFLFRQQTGQASSQGGESSAFEWGGTSAAAPPPPPPTSEDAPSKLFETLSIDTSSSTNPWRPAPQEVLVDSQPLHTSSEDSATKAWSAPPGRQAPGPPVDSQDRRLSVSSQDSDDWNDERKGSEIQAAPTQLQIVSPINEEQDAWEESIKAPQRPDNDAKAEERAEKIEQIGKDTNGWQDPDQSSGIADANAGQASSTEQEEDRPSLPPRQQTLDQAPPKPPRPARDMLKETYEIKKISWHDVSASFNPRISPILVQNANGPCPLLALVNALTISTPAGLDTALVERLRSREQVSLQFLLEGVMDEFMRRSDNSTKIPDLEELFAFLVTLHTGMNVNPKFFPPESTNSTTDPRNSMSHVHPSQRESLLPGTFEDTREMKLYGTFSVPLIHGWLPSPETPAHAALSRSARSYEDAQNLMFREEELEEKFSRETLSFEEQAILEDISTIKEFLSSNPTQLTTNGLETITTSMIPGSVAILFRNDHFSTLYRHPETKQLLQLVTDMGYAGHDEVVWESLADVNGENCEFFSGDFRIVGQNSEYQSADEGFTTVQGRSKNKGRSTDARSPSSNQQYNPPPGPPPGHMSEVYSPTTEQEDHDLALAMQLQEEEEENQRKAIARRKQESDYSERYIEQQANIGVNNSPSSSNRGSSNGRGGNPSIRGARSNSSRGSLSSQSPLISGSGPSLSRPVVPPRRGGSSLQGSESAARQRTASIAARAPQTNRPVDPDAGDDAPPPSYEVASSQAPYTPPSNHPAHPSAIAAQAANAQGGAAVPGARRTSNFSQANGNVVYGGGRRNGSRVSNSVQSPVYNGASVDQAQRGDKNCAIM